MTKICSEKKGLDNVNLSERADSLGVICCSTHSIRNLVRTLF